MPAGDAVPGTRKVRVVLTTQHGAIEVAVDLARAPVSAGDFLKYVDRGLFNGGAFYRTVRPDNDINPVKIDVIQGGVTDKRKMLPPIRHESTNETGLHHRNATISIARRAPGTGTAGAFFICIGDQPELDFGGRSPGLCRFRPRRTRHGRGPHDLEVQDRRPRRRHGCAEARAADQNRQRETGLKRLTPLAAKGFSALRLALKNWAKQG